MHVVIQRENVPGDNIVMGLQRLLVLIKDIIRLAVLPLVQLIPQRRLSVHLKTVVVLQVRIIVVQVYSVFPIDVSQILENVQMVQPKEAVVQQQVKDALGQDLIQEFYSVLPIVLVRPEGGLRLRNQLNPPVVMQMAIIGSQTPLPVLLKVGRRPEQDRRKSIYTLMTNSKGNFRLLCPAVNIKTITDLISI